VTGGAAADWEGLRHGRAVFEDEAALVLNKPAGISVTGERHETDLVRLAAAAGVELFPVHRIDKVTSGAVLLAKGLRWHGGLTRQFGKQTVSKAYLAIVAPGGLPEAGTVCLPLSVGRKNRVRVAAQRAAIVADEAAATWSVPPEAVFGQVRVYPSLTRFTRLWQDDARALLAVWPVTGRRHQIRVHLAWIGHPVAGDPLFPAAHAGLPRAHLHSWRLAFTADWRAGERLAVEAPPGDGFWDPLARALPGGDPAPLLAAARAQCQPLETNAAP
jgi:tRNA pseudouridine32 synthase/23S rRNA pseudouridine746 synthase/23S rRNA pseudouridine1911/1915/1917 synthase